MIIIESNIFLCFYVNSQTIKSTFFVLPMSPIAFIPEMPRINRRHIYFTTILLFCLLLKNHNANAIQFNNGNNHYSLFFGTTENYFLIQPTLVKKIFYNLASLHGNKIKSRRVINQTMFQCGTGEQCYSNCRIDKLKQLRKKQRISSYITMPVIFTDITSRPYKRKKRLVTLTWKPDPITPPTMQTTDFLEYINTKGDSKYFTINPKIKLLRFSPSFQEEIHIIMDKAIAKNLLKLYSQPQNDFRDRITFKYQNSSFLSESGVGYIRLHWKARKIKINNQLFSVEPEDIF